MIGLLQGCFTDKEKYRSMKKIFTLFIALVFTCSLSAQDSLLIQGINFKVDTVVYKHDVGLGSMLTKYSLPDLPLMVSVLEIDVSNPYIEVVSVLSNDSLRGLEQPSQMAARNSVEGLELFGGVNADFFVTKGYDKGLPVNGQILEGQLAKVPAPARPLIAFDSDKQSFLDLMSFEGSVTVGEETRQLDGVNSERGADQLILFNQYHGTTTRTNQFGNEVVVGLTGNKWNINQPLNCVVEEVQTGTGSADLPAGKAVLSGHGAAADYLSSLQPNDQIEIEINIDISGDASASPDLEEMVGGDRIMLENGVVVDNDWPQLHPRTAAGFSEDKSKVILAVVDGRNNDLSIGVSTKQLADIMKLAGAWWAMNLDGGGSSAMVVRDKIVNTPSDGNERSVANALFFASTAPAAEAVDFKLNAEHISIPYGQKTTIKGSTFNEHGDVVDYLDVPGVTYIIKGDIGTIDGQGLFSASGVIGDGMIIGEWNGTSDTVFVTVDPSIDLVLAVKELTIDHLNTYKFDVYGHNSDGTYYQIDNELISFESSDTSVGEVDSNGIFTGKTDGKVTVRTFIEGTDIEDECNVDVEIGRGYRLLDDFSEPSSEDYSDRTISAPI